MNDIKFCKDCKHLEPKEKVFCNRPAKIDFVHGGYIKRNIYAQLERTLDLTGCGEKAKYFEPIRNTSNIQSEF